MFETWYIKKWQDRLLLFLSRTDQGKRKISVIFSSSLSLTLGPTVPGINKHFTAKCTYKVII